MAAIDNANDDDDDERGDSQSMFQLGDLQEESVRLSTKRTCFGTRSVGVAA